MLYGDTSALLKLYITERGSTETAREVAAANAIGTSALTRVEIEATLARAVKAGRIPATDLPLLMSRLNRDWSGLFIVPVSPALLAEASVLTWRHGLRAADAIHLASALQLEQLAGEPVTLATFDDELWQASTQQGVTAWPPALAAFR